MASSRSICSYGAACYRRNPEHFRQMSHPHLENLLDEIADDKPIDVPEKLNFACTSRALLKEQLEVLRTTRQSKCNSEDERPRANVQGNNATENDTSLRSQTIKMLRDCGELPEYVAPQGMFAEKHKNAAPYYIFFTAVQKARPTWNRKESVTLSEILDKSLGKIVMSLHLNFVVDLGWICSQYMLAEQTRDMVIFYGDRVDESPLPSNIKMHKMTCPNKFGCHHSKFSILQYDDGGIRVIVSTANLYKDDWHLRTQGLWMSPHLPRLPTTARDADGESKTGFKKELINYLSQYSAEMDRWKTVVKRANFSSINVALVFSVPSQNRTDVEKDRWGYRKLATLLKKHVEIPDNEPRSTIIAQASSMGNFGEYNSWVGSQLVKSMSKTTRKDGDVSLKVIFPTIENYKSSYDMREAANCLCYSEAQHLKQAWLGRYLHQWVADRNGRSSAVPHIKTFTRISSDESKIWWFSLGSANLSKAAWGYYYGQTVSVLNYEASVVFLPKFVIPGATSFPVTSNPDNKTPTFPIPYDLPLTPYRKEDKPFVADFFQKGDRVFSG